MQSRNNMQFISVDSIHSNLGKNFCKALPLKKLEKYIQAQIPFGHLGQLDADQCNNSAEIENFTCKTYGKENLEKIDVRTEIFMEKYKPKTNGDKMSCAKKLDVSMMPPCERVLLNKIRRTKFVAKLWMSSIEASPPNDSPLDFGWKLVDRNYQLLWFEGDLRPSSLDITYEYEKHDGQYGMSLLLFSECLFLLHF